MNNNDIKKNDEWFNEIYILYYEFVYEMLKTHLYSKVDDDELIKSVGWSMI